ncbi:hypothetical protein BVC80_1101g41 [Macleaya cordata]|uniref:Transmembrane protein n=1 Tax=Macleaya cordata TaxID=56857 RepID=A0A200QCL0_MACCD|nr:hypothetical protein BVC80_1101g41 [Macleaya cordata]
MMAAAEARAAWQRTANRCMVQEDAKRAPKLACCSSSSSSSKPQVDVGPGDASNGPDHSNAGFMHLNWNSSNSNLPLDTKWWLQLQPNYGNQKDITYEQLNALETELESLRSEEVKATSKSIGDPPVSEESFTQVDKNTGFSLDPHRRVSTTCMKNDPEAKMQELKAVNSNNTQKPLKRKDAGEYWCKDEELTDLDPIDQLLLKQTFDMESPWMGGGKAEPWWRTVDKDELASLVAQKSLEHIENCDLPPPQSMKVRRGPFSCLENFDHDDIFSSSLDVKANTAVRNGSPTCGFGEKGYSLYGSEKTFSYSSTNTYSTTSKDSTETRQTSESEPSKAQLLEALRHSQTRAREAEKAAQQAYSEKEHIIKLFFKQASHLFAYKQWLQLLQLETICLQLKNKDQPISNLFPVVLPWMPQKGRQSKRDKPKPKKGKRGPPRYDISKYAFAFAVGLGLAGAGLLLGWTMGWLFPML